jgi:molecular chaperone DnaJ
MLNRSGVVGDQLIYINVYIPEKLSPTEKGIIEKLLENQSFYPDSKKKNKNFFERMGEFFTK